MAERVYLYQAADGSMHNSEMEADRHDARNALKKKIDPFVESRVKHRTVSKNKMKALMEEFTLELIFPAIESNETRPEPEDQGPQT